MQSTGMQSNWQGADSYHADGITVIPIRAAQSEG